MTTPDETYGYPRFVPEAPYQAQHSAARPTDRIFEGVTLESAGPNLRAEALHHAVLFHGPDSTADDVVRTAQVFHDFLVEAS